MVVRTFVLIVVFLMNSWAQSQDTPPKESTREEPRGIQIPVGVKVYRDLEYGSEGHVRHRLDLYLPEHAKPPFPLILWVHGGGWTGGDKSRCPGLFLLDEGFAVASMNYRFSQHAVFPAQLHDCKGAIRWLRAQAMNYQLDSQHFGVWGGSAGGQLVAMLGTTLRNPEMEGNLGNLDQSSDVQAVLDWYGPTDFLTVGPKETRTQLLGGDPLVHRDKAIFASPLHHVSKNAAPFLIVHGDQDKTVPIAQSQLFAESLQKHGVEATFITIEGGGHGGAKFLSPSQKKRIIDFFAKHLRSR